MAHPPLPHLPMPHLLMPELPPPLFQDNRFVVLDKPAGLPVHAGPLGGRSVEDWFPQLSRRKDGPWLAHRLDADTAGCLVVALRRAALLAAQAAFVQGHVLKEYWAVVRGRPERQSGVVDQPLSKRTGVAGWRMVPDAGGVAAVTRWRVLGSWSGEGGELTWLGLHPRTGRTHQVRVHCAVLGCPIVGDAVYGRGAGAGERLHLLARSILVPLEPAVMATAQPPAHMRAALGACGWVE